MRTKEDVENYLLKMDQEYKEVSDGTYQLIDDLPDVNDVFVYVRDPLVVFVVRLMKVPSQNREAFFAKLLELNSSLVAGAYAINHEDVIITDTLQLENLDFNEFEAAAYYLAYAIHEHYPDLIKYSDENDKDAKADDKKAE